MTGQSSQLPWDALWVRAEEIPWDAMTAFVDAVAVDMGVADELLKAYDESRRKPDDEACYMDLYVPAIFAMAAPRLSDEQRRRIGASLLERLAQAGRAGDDLDEEAMQAACGAMGPAILPAVLDVIAREPDLEGAWYALWQLTELAVDADAAIRERVVQACAAMLEKVDRKEVESDAGMGAAWTLGWLQRTEYIDLLDRLGRESVSFLGGADYLEVARILRGKHRLPGSDRLWEQPVEKWLKPSWMYVKDWISRPHPEPAIIPEEDSVGRMDDVTQVLDRPFTPPIPIVNVSPKIGRNEPCPCGSGKKYKKCCGRAVQDQVQNPS